MDKKRILIIGATSTSLTNFRGDFIRCLIKEGFDIYTAASNYSGDTISRLKDFGVVSTFDYTLQRTGLNPFNDLKTIFDLKKIIKENNIDLVFPYTVKPVIYGTFAANMCKVPVISLITGLGFAFTGLTFKAKVLQRLNEFLYKRTIRKNKVVVFQNSDDRNLFLERNILKPKNNTAIVSGSGINLDNFNFRVNNNTTNTISFLIVARLIREKGINLYVDAAKILKKKHPNAEFHVIGPAQNSPSAIKIEELIALNEEGTLIYHGGQSNIPEHLVNRDVFVLPSFYREGVPRSILEALSVGLPIITTDTPGCRETVLKNKNGILIAPQSLDELVEAMTFFITNREKLKEMGVNSRKYAEERFDVNIINNDLLKIINSVFDTLN